MGAGDSWGSEGGREGYSSRRNALSEIAAEIDRLEQSRDTGRDLINAFPR